ARASPHDDPDRLALVASVADPKAQELPLPRFAGTPQLQVQLTGVLAVEDVSDLHRDAAVAAERIGGGAHAGLPADGCGRTAKAALSSARRIALEQAALRTAPGHDDDAVFLPGGSRVRHEQEPGRLRLALRPFLAELSVGVAMVDAVAALHGDAAVAADRI